MAQDSGQTEPRDTSVPKFDQFKTPHDIPEAFEKMENVTALHHGRSGNLIAAGDNKNGEFLMFQHVSGSAFYINPDGAVQFISHNGQNSLIFGENRVMITGAHDIVVHGGGSMKVDGDYNTTIMGDCIQTIQGDMITSCKNRFETVNGMNSQIAQNHAMMASESVSVSSKEHMSIAAGKGLGISSQSDGIKIEGKGDVSIESTGGSMNFVSKGMFNLFSGGDINMDASPKIYFNSNKATAGDAQKGKFKAASPATQEANAYMLTQTATAIT
jgi:hypothetical protein